MRVIPTSAAALLNHWTTGRTADLETLDDDDDEIRKKIQ